MKMNDTAQNTCKIYNQEQSGNTIQVLYPKDAANSQRGQSNGMPLDPTASASRRGAQGPSNYSRDVQLIQCKRYWKASCMLQKYRMGCK